MVIRRDGMYRTSRSGATGGFRRDAGVCRCVVFTRNTSARPFVSVSKIRWGKYKSESAILIGFHIMSRFSFFFYYFPRLLLYSSLSCDSLSIFYQTHFILYFLCNFFLNRTLLINNIFYVNHGKWVLDLNQLYCQ